MNKEQYVSFKLAKLLKETQNEDIMSKRQEDFREMSKDLHVQFLSNPWTIYETGCEDGYQYAVDKAEKWIKENVLEFEHQSFVHEFDDCIKDFRKAMED